MPSGGEGAGAEEGQVGCDQREDASAAPAREEGEGDEGRGGRDEFGVGKRDIRVNQDARGDGSQRPEQGVLHQLRAIVTTGNAGPEACTIEGMV
jgi:hypothetical protein